MHVPEDEIERVMNILRSDPREITHDVAVRTILENPMFNRLQVFSNQSIRIVDNATLQYLYVSDSIFEMTGYTRDQVMKGGLLFTYRNIHAVDLFRLGKMLLKVRKVISGLTDEQKLLARLSFDVRFRCADGVFKCILQNVHILSLSRDSKPHVLMFTSTDITPYKRGDGMNYTLGIQEEGKGFVNLVEGTLHEDSLPLSRRELEILKLTSEGLSEVEIGEKLLLSRETVKTHRKNMLHKTAARNSVDLVRIGIANGWI